MLLPPHLVEDQKPPEQAGGKLERAVQWSKDNATSYAVLLSTPEHEGKHWKGKKGCKKFQKYIFNSDCIKQWSHEWRFPPAPGLLTPLCWWRSHSHASAQENGVNETQTISSHKRLGWQAPSGHKHISTAMGHALGQISCWHHGWGRKNQHWQHIDIQNFYPHNPLLTLVGLRGSIRRNITNHWINGNQTHGTKLLLSDDFS